MGFNPTTFHTSKFGIYQSVSQFNSSLIFYTLGLHNNNYLASMKFITYIVISLTKTDNLNLMTEVDDGETQYK